MSNWQNLFTDDDGMTWNILERSDGSFSLYGTKPGADCHFVIHDTLDAGNYGNFNETTLKVLSRLRFMRDGISAFIDATHQLRKSA